MRCKRVDDMYNYIPKNNTKNQIEVAPFAYWLVNLVKVGGEKEQTLFLSLCVTICYIYETQSSEADIFSPSKLYFSQLFFAQHFSNSRYQSLLSLIFHSKCNFPFTKHVFVSNALVTPINRCFNISIYLLSLLHFKAYVLFSFSDDFYNHHLYVKHNRFVGNLLAAEMFLIWGRLCVAF